MRYYISDLHFFHGALNEKMDGRGFADTADMNACMISQWNRKVRRNDEVVILGDLSIGKGEETNWVLNQLKGRLYLIEGNHDRFLKDASFRPERFVWIKPYAEMHDNGRKVILSHYPILCYNGQYRADEDGAPKTYMLYGHVHDTMDERLVNRFIEETRQTERLLCGSAEPQKIPCHLINCFCMFSDYTPLTLDEWIAVDAKRRAGLLQKEDR